jgi:hypothetical protein
MISRFRADILFILIGAIPIIVAYRLHDGLTRDLTKDFGVVIISLALVDLLWLLVAGGEPLSREIAAVRSLIVVTQQAYLSGLTDVAARRSGLLLANASLATLISASKSNIDMSGYTLFRLKENPRLIDALAQKARDGVKVRLLLCAPDNVAFPSCVDVSVLDAMKTQMEATWLHLVQTQQSLSNVYRKNLVVKRMRKKWPYTSVLRFDDQINALHYLHSKYTEETPVYVCRGAEGPLFKTYLAEFEYCFAWGDVC